MQLEMLRYQSEMAAKLQEISKSFDENGDGRLTGGEQGRYEKHMREIRTGKVVNPFAAITPLGMGKRPKSPIAELERQAASHNAAVLAKQREIYNSFDENGDGNLTGAEKARFDKHMHAIQTGAVPNPFAAAGSGTAGKR
jgi:Ca2+-binding EF-hand superfamily protein